MQKIFAALALVLVAAAASPSVLHAQSDAEAAAREFLEVSRSQENFQRGFELGVQEGAEDVTPEMLAVIRTTMQEHFPWAEMEREFIQLYVELFTAEEIRAITAFYRTPAGQKMVAVTPEIAIRTQRLTNERLQVMMPVLMQRLMEVMADN
jgi:uncharacterized protein